MKHLYIIALFFSLAGVIISSCSGCKNSTRSSIYNYKPDDQALYDTISQLDSLFFAAYNTCTINLDKYAAFYSQNLEFYHDKSGLTTSKQDVVEATKKNICGKVTRELVKGSIEVYPIKDYGAIEIGLHMFHNHAEKQTGPPKISKFIITWHRENNEWKIAKVISLH